MSADITLTGNKVRFVRLTQQEYAAIGTKDVDALYFITDSTEHPIYRGSERLATYGVATQSAAGLLSAADKTKLDGLNKGVANGVAGLGSDGKVPSGQLPSYVDDVLEFATKSAFPATGESGKIYVDLSTNRVYRWSGSTYIEIAADRLELGETSTTAYRGDRGKIAYDHSQAAHARTDATKTEASSTNGNIKINGTETTVYVHPAGTNPHGTTKSDVGLGNVGNFKAVSTEASQGLTTTEQSNARANIGAGTSNLSIGETSSTAYRGDRGKAAYDHSQSAHARTDATKTEASSINGNIKINGNETTVYTHPSGTNPHGTTKADVGLGNVGNFKAVSTEASQGLTSTEQANARANIGAGTGSSNLALGETSSTAYRGDRGKTAYDHSQSAHARTDATKVEASETNGNILVNGTETTVYTHPSGTNPHGTTKADVGLGNVGNFKAVSTVASQGLSSTEQSNARANIGAGTSNLALGETSSTAYRGDRGTLAYNHSQAAHARTDATKTEASETNGNIKINGTETTVYTHPAGTNPHGTTKSDVGLGNVGNFKAVSTVASQGLTSTEQSNARANIGAGTGNSNLALGETSSTAYRGDRGKTAYDHSQATHARTDATATSASSTNGNIKINGTETTVYTHPTATAADAAAVKVGKDSAGHVVLGGALSKSDVGLGNVGNFKAVSTVASQGLSSTEQANARANIGAGTGSSNLTLGETSSTAYRGDRGKTAYDHSQTAHAPSDANKVEASTTNGNIKIAGTETTVYTHPSGTNPHGTTKSDVGLGNVGNFKAVSTVASQGLTSTEQSNARANIGAGTGDGTIKGITMNGSSKGTSGVVDLGTVITSHQSLANYATKSYVDGAIPTVDQTYNATSANAQSGIAVASAIAALPEPMIFKGSLGTGGTITTLPTASSSNEGFVYKVITAGTYASQAAKVGDTFISDGSSWVLIPSGDEPGGTVTSVATGSGLTGGPITTSGTLSLATAYGDTVNPYGNKTANYVLAAPNGSNGTPSFRTLVAADIPSITKSKISDFPSSMPASDVSAWAKASTKPSYTANEVGAQPTLVSGTNIKTINNQSLLGSGDISISSGGGSYCIDIDKWITQTATSQDYADIEDAIQTGKYLYIGQEDEQSGEIFHSPVTCSMITEDSEIICYYIEDDTVHMYTFHSDGTYYYEYHYLQRKLTAGSGIEINSSNVISATGTSNWLDGSQTGSVRTSGSKEEDSNYTIGEYAIAEGRGTYAKGNRSHAEGSDTRAFGNYSHTEGYFTWAVGSRSHAEGNNTWAGGDNSHAEGASAHANGNRSHAEGDNTIASGNSSHVQGKYNIEDPSAYTKTTDTSVDSSKTYYTLSNGKFDVVGSPTTSGLSNYYEFTSENAQQAFIIGNGASDSSRSNALTVDWDGNLDIAGNLQIGDSAWVNKVIDLDSTVAPSSDKWKTAIHIKDKNDLSLGYLEGAVLSNGNNGMTLTARRNISGTNYYNGVRLLIDDSGKPVTQFNDANAWRQGLGLSLSSVQNIASYITSTKGTFVSGQIITYDRIAQLIIRFRNTSAVGSGGNIYEGTLTKWHPVSLNGSGVNGIGYFGASALVGYINSSGGIIVRNASNSSVTINSSSNAYVTFTYLMGANQ